MKILLLLLLLSNNIFGAILAWDASPEPTVAGYLVHYGTASGVYTVTVDVGNALTSTVPDPPVGVTYFAVVTAYDGSSMQSPPSNEVTFTGVSSQPKVVTTVADESNDDAEYSLREILAICVRGEVVTFAPSLNGQSIVLTLGALAIPRDVRIDASALSKGIVINGNNLTHAFNISVTTLTYLTITNCNSPTSGGVIKKTDTGLCVINNCTFYNNSSSQDGGVLYSTSGDTMFINCTLTNNSAQKGGVVYLDSGIVSVRHCTVVGNTATVGGAVFNQGGSCDTSNSIYYNTASIDPNFSGNYIPLNENWVTGNPKLGKLLSYSSRIKTMMPLPNSPVIDAGQELTSPDKDQLGQPRKVGMYPDLGAVESYGYLNNTFIDNNSNGIDDLIEENYPHLTAENKDTLDSDGDGVKDIDELGSMTDPFDPSDKLTILELYLTWPASETVTMTVGGNTNPWNVFVIANLETDEGYWLDGLPMNHVLVWPLQTITWTATGTVSISNTIPRTDADGGTYILSHQAKNGVSALINQKGGALVGVWSNGQAFVMGKSGSAVVPIGVRSLRMGIMDSDAYFPSWDNNPGEYVVSITNNGRPNGENEREIIFATKPGIGYTLISSTDLPFSNEVVFDELFATGPITVVKWISANRKDFIKVRRN